MFSQLITHSLYINTLLGAFSCAQIDSRKARERELATFDENRRAAGVSNPIHDKN